MDQLSRWIASRAPLAAWLLVAAVGLAAAGFFHSYFVRSVRDGMNDEYDDIAVNLVVHGRFSANLDHWDRPTVTRGPVYPIYLAGLFRLCGLRNTRASTPVDMLLHATAAALLVAALGRLVAPLAALAGGLAFAFWPTTFYYAAKGSSETMLNLLLATSLLLLVRLRARPHVAPAAVLGAVLALACLTRGSAVILLAIVAVWALASMRRRRLPARVVLALAIAWAAVMSPWWLRNARVSGAFVPFHTLTWYNAFHDDVFDHARQWLAGHGMSRTDWGAVPMERYPATVERHPPGATYPPMLDAHADLAQERRYREIMLAKFRSPGYLVEKMLRNAVDFWAASASASRTRVLLATSVAWLGLFGFGLARAWRDPALRWLVTICFAAVFLTWAMYLPLLALFRHSIPTAPFVAAAIGLGLGARHPRAAVSPR